MAAESSIDITHLDLGVDNLDALLEFARERAIDLTVIGPEAPLAAGIVDRWKAAGLRCFGPTQAAAQLESSKAYAKAFMQRWDIPTARSETFTDYDAARAFLDAIDWQPVLKASGLAAGKGVVLPETNDEAHAELESMMRDGRFGEAGAQVVIEERLVGEEVSLLAFCDNHSVAVMPPARDHKRLKDGDEGPNTGGMGAYAPTPAISDTQIQEMTQVVLQRTVDGMAAEASFHGILYAGLMLTAEGAKVLEFNCRFGDPEAQVLLPLLKTDLVTVFDRCIDGGLRSASIEWYHGAAATVVLASPGYREAIRKACPPVVEAANALADVCVYHAGTKTTEAGLQTAGGRVLTVTGRGSDLTDALNKAYGV